MSKPNPSTTRGTIAVAVLLAAAAVTGSAGAAAADTKPRAPEHVKFTGVPKKITVTATSPAGAVVRYTPPVVRDQDTATVLPVTCTPPSGSTFRVGRTKVVCTAGTGDGKRAVRSFEVTVRPAPRPPRPTVTLDRSRVTFSSTAGAARTGSVVATNHGPGAATIGPVRISGHDARAFTETDNCGPTLAAGAHCTITVTYTPGTAGNRHGKKAKDQKAKMVIDHRTVQLTATATRPREHGKHQLQQDRGSH
jgi:hypothetical protein